MAKILSITPALPGWYSVFKDGDGEFVLPVALWALVEDDEDPSLRWPTSFSVSEGDGSSTFTVTDDEDRSFIGHRYVDPMAAPK
ncbi:hypothetical protein [Stenotrophomonas rhizophila]|uniref:hypothetical protein n=1 Tax=Stenotrophomonas rhizophila TaxID=216778 RepID=UPI0028A945C4|nr:hypothetical protein [Stenotrophomonas rhizophila]